MDVQVKLLKDHRVRGKQYRSGELVTVPDEQAFAMSRSGVVAARDMPANPGTAPGLDFRGRTIERRIIS